MNLKARYSAYRVLETLRFAGYQKKRYTKLPTLKTHSVSEPRRLLLDWQIALPYVDSCALTHVAIRKDRHPSEDGWSRERSASGHVTIRKDDCAQLDALLTKYLHTLKKKS